MFFKSETKSVDFSVGDIQSYSRKLQDAVDNAEGTVIVITHDHRMIDRLEARHLVVDDGEVTELPKGQKPIEFA